MSRSRRLWCSASRLTRLQFSSRSGRQIGPPAQWVLPGARAPDGARLCSDVRPSGDTRDLTAGATRGRIVKNTYIRTHTPKGTNTGPAIVVFPGGGYEILAVDVEGTEVCDWLTSKGITCVLLKYRVPGAGKHPESGPYPDFPAALEDAQGTVGLVRYRAAKWHIDPRKIGVLGFSAGGHLVAAMSTLFPQRVNPAVDEADTASCRPDFAVALYPGHLALDPKRHELNPDIHVTSQTPPTFLLQASGRGARTRMTRSASCSSN